jgi:hypothetical protein
LNEFRRFAVVNLAAQPLDADVHQITLRIKVIFPNALAKLCSGKHTPWGPHQTLQQGKFSSSQVNATTASSSNTSSQIKSQILNAIANEVFARVATKESADASDELVN